MTFQPVNPISEYTRELYWWAEHHLEPMPERPRLPPEPEPEPEPTLCRAYSPVVILLGFLAFWVIVGYAWGLRWW